MPLALQLWHIYSGLVNTPLFSGWPVTFLHPSSRKLHLNQPFRTVLAMFVYAPSGLLVDVHWVCKSKTMSVNPPHIKSSAVIFESICCDIEVDTTHFTVHWLSIVKGLAVQVWWLQKTLGVPCTCCSHSKGNCNHEELILGNINAIGIDRGSGIERPSCSCSTGCGATPVQFYTQCSADFTSRAH